jgi:hypothetical protein
MYLHILAVNKEHGKAVISHLRLNAAVFMYSTFAFKLNPLLIQALDVFVF